MRPRIFSNYCRTVTPVIWYSPIVFRFYFRFVTVMILLTMVSLSISPFTFNEQCQAICSDKVLLHLSFPNSGATHYGLPPCDMLFKESPGSFAGSGHASNWWQTTASQIRHANNPNPVPSDKFEIQQLRNICKEWSNSARTSVPGTFPNSCWQVVRSNSKLRLASWCLPKHHSHRKVFSTVCPRSSSCTRVLPIVLLKSFPCQKEYFPCPFQVLHTVMTKPCTCQCVVSTLCFICYLAPRVPPLLGGGGGGVSGGGFEGLTVSSASASSSKNTPAPTPESEK